MLNCIQLETGGRNRLQSVFEMRNEICPISSTLLPIIIPNCEGKCKVAKTRNMNKQLHGYNKLRQKRKITLIINFMAPKTWLHECCNTFLLKPKQAGLKQPWELESFLKVVV